jgi:6-phosphogluconolactonase (cycloisomerase 2 family)
MSTPATHTLLVGGYTSNIRTLRFDPQANKLELVQTSETLPSPSWIEPSPTTKAFYSVSEDEDGGKVFSYEVGSDGKIIKTAELPTGGVPAHGVFCHTRRIHG